MAEEPVRQIEEPKATERRRLADKIGGVGWGLFFLWVGISSLMDLGWGVGLLGVGIITLGGQGVRKFFSLGLEAFWVVVGLCFALGGLWELFQPKLPLVPILLIVAGLALIFLEASGPGSSAVTPNEWVQLTARRGRC